MARRVIKSDRTPKKVRREVKVSLSKAQVDERGRILAQRSAELEELQEAAKASTAEWKGKTDAARLGMTKLARSIREGHELIEVDCEERYDDRRGLVNLVRLDTEELVDERAQTAAERQQVIPETQQADPDDEDPDDAG